LDQVFATSYHLCRLESSLLDCELTLQPHILVKAMFGLHD
jgi:hypothetical protein